MMARRPALVRSQGLTEPRRHSVDDGTDSVGPLNAGIR